MSATRADTYVHAKVPETITPWFWATKIFMTATGEAISDAMNQQLGPAISVPIMLILLTAVVAAVSIFGTSAADAFHVGIGMPYWSTTLMYAVIVTVIFLLWHRSEGTLDIHSIVNRRRERFYWLTVLGSFALGTASGDWTAVDLHLAYLPSFLLFGALILIPLVLWRRGVNAVFTFWFAYTLTRPFGASWADYSDMPIHQAGLNLGQIPTAISLGLVTAGLVAYMHARRIGYHDDIVVASAEAAPEPA
jgi:uncharacterized membrane-anchored protein